MRTKLKTFVMMVILSIFMAMTSFANEITWESAIGHHNQSILLPSTEMTAKDIVQRNARGDYLSMGTVEINNMENGTIRIIAETYAHCNVDWMRHTIFLDQWDDEKEDWVQVGYWDFERYKEDVENNELYYFATEMTLSGYSVNKYYRVRGLHAVELYDEIEACATETNGILITNGPT